MAKFTRARKAYARVRTRYVTRPRMAYRKKKTPWYFFAAAAVAAIFFIPAFAGIKAKFMSIFSHKQN